MNKWKIILEHNLKTVELEFEALSFSDAYMEAERRYPGCKIISIKNLDTKYSD